MKPKEINPSPQKLSLFVLAGPEHATALRVSGAPQDGPGLHKQSFPGVLLTREWGWMGLFGVT